MRQRQRNSLIEQELLPHLDSLFRYAMSLTRDRVQAEELTQDTMLKGIRAFHQFEAGTNARAWLFRIMINTWINQKKRRGTSVEFDETALGLMSSSEDLSIWVRNSANPEQNLVNMFSRSQLQTALDALPPDFQSVVILADLEGFSYKEVADTLSCPIGTVMSRLHRGRRLLRLSLAHWAEELGIIEDAGIMEGGEEGTLEANITPLAPFRNHKTKARAASASEESDEV